jgi:hypothetical protein
MNIEKTIADIELLEHIFTLPDYRSLPVADWNVENRKDYEPYALHLPYLPH